MKRKLTLLLALAILAVNWLVLEATRTEVPAADFQEKLEASALSQRCMDYIREQKADLGIAVDGAADINGTGMIGQSYSAITTTLGSLEAKRTSINPNMAAAVVDMLHELGVERGDRVAVNCSGSFPALNISVLCAIQTLGLEPVMMASFGSSTHGANDPAFTYLDMEYALWDAGLLEHRSDWFSVGGMEDLGKEMDPQVREQVTARLEGLGYRLFYEEELLENIRQRYALYREEDVVCFINVGGNDVSFGDSSVIVHADGGILTKLSENDHSTGLVQLFLRDGVPVIHLLNIKSLAAQYGLPFDPTPMPDVGEGGVYSVRAYHRYGAVPGLLAAGAVLSWDWLKSRKERQQ